MKKMLLGFALVLMPFLSAISKNVEIKHTGTLPNGHTCYLSLYLDQLYDSASLGFSYQWKYPHPLTDPDTGEVVEYGYLGFEAFMDSYSEWEAAWDDAINKNVPISAEGGENFIDGKLKVYIKNGEVEKVEAQVEAWDFTENVTCTITSKTESDL